MNQFQKAACIHYGGGDFAWMLEDPDKWREHVTNCGDTLFTFVMVELATREGCETLDDATGRIARAGADLQDVLAALEAMEVSA